MRFSLLASAIFTLTAVSANAAQEAVTDSCLLAKLKEAAPHTTVAEIKAECEVESIPPEINRGVVSKRVIAERKVEFNPYVITPHKMNYILPAAITDNFNAKPYEDIPGLAKNMEDVEAKYQISIKVPLNSDSLFVEHDKLYFGVTLQSWWQIYSQNISKPFRETNYQPEIAYLAPTNWHPFSRQLEVSLHCSLPGQVAT